MKTRTIAFAAGLWLYSSGQAQVVVEDGRMGGLPFDSVSMSDILGWFSERPVIAYGQAGWATDVNRTLFQRAVPFTMTYESTGAFFLFQDSTDRSSLLRAEFRRRGVCRTSIGIDVGDRITADVSSDSSGFARVEYDGRRYLEQFRHGVTYLCTPTDPRRALKKQKVKVKIILVGSRLGPI